MHGMANTPNPRGRPRQGEHLKASSVTLNRTTGEADPYPAVLELIGNALEYGFFADNIGGVEPVILTEIAVAVRGVLERRDPMSVHFIPPKRHFQRL